MYAMRRRSKANMDGIERKNVVMHRAGTGADSTLCREHGVVKKRRGYCAQCC